MTKSLNILFFGTPDIAVHVLDELKDAALMPNVIISNPDAPIGRKQVLTSPPAAQWAMDNNVELFQPASLKDAANLERITNQEWDLFVVVAYGKILPKWLIELPKHGTLNLHPSLLPELRGASPIRSAILEDRRETGVTIMLMDEELDHGPILAQEFSDIKEDEWPLDGQVLDKKLATEGGRLLVEVIPEWIEGNIAPQEQNHESATFSTKISKDMSELKINPLKLPKANDAYKILLKIRAFSGWPETFFIHGGKRVKIKKASISDTGQLEIQTVVPEGKKETSFEEYLKSIA